MENSFNVWFLEKGIWVAIIGVAGLVGIWAFSVILFKGLQLLGLDTERIKDNKSQRLISKVKNIFVILAACYL